jgi:serine/threonine protein phosphatase PrpC
MKVETFTRQGEREWNEDAWVRNDRLQMYGVLDGATSLVPYRSPQGETGGYLAAQLVKRFLEELDEVGEPSLTLEDAVLYANKTLREAMVAEGIDIKQKEALWSCGLAMVRIRENHVEYIQAGDCQIAALYEDGTIRTLSYDHVAYWDNASKREWENGIRQGKTTKQALWDHALPAIVRSRLQMNSPGGFPIVNGEPELVSYLEYGRINRVRLKSLLMATDGFYIPETHIRHASDTAALAARIRETGLAAFADRLCAMEESDPHCVRYPRFKKSDDKSAVWIEL